MYDTIEVFRKLQVDFPHLKFEIRSEVGVNRFYLTELSNRKFENPIKTSILINESKNLTEKQYNTIHRKMCESFGVLKLLGLI